MTSVGNRVAIKLPSPEPFNGNLKEARTWLNQMKRWLAATGSNLEEPIEPLVSKTACTIAMAMLKGDAAKWADRLEVRGIYPTTWEEFQE